MNKLKDFWQWVLYHNRIPNEKASALALMILLIACGLFLIVPILLVLFLGTMPYSLAAIPIGVIAWAYRDFSNDSGDE